MPTIRVTETTTAAPDAVVAALTDFGPRRRQLFPTSAESHFRLHGQGPSWADVTEGNAQAGGNWERLRYDWATPGVVTATTTDSNLWGGASGYTWRVAGGAGGGSTVDVVVVREPKNLRARVLGAVLAAAGRRLVRQGTRTMLGVVEAGQPR